MSTVYDHRAAAGRLRLIATTEPDDDAVALLQAIADYIDSTADGYSRETYAEIAMAYREGYEHATADTLRIESALRAAGLSL